MTDAPSPSSSLSLEWLAQSLRRTVARWLGRTARGTDRRRIALSDLLPNPYFAMDR